MQEVGKVINPVLAAGQIEGGVAQAIGWALYEDVVWREGRMANGQMTNYIMPTSMDLPPHPRRVRRVPVSARPGGRQRHRRAADGRSRAGDRQCRAHATGLDVTAAAADARSVARCDRSAERRVADRDACTVSLHASTAQPSASRRIRWRGCSTSLRQQLHLTGTKEGCGEGECGACAVLIDGELVNSCLVPVLQADGAVVTTIEGVADGERLHAVQEAFIAHGGAQCGICTPGMVLAAVSLLQRTPQADDEEIRNALWPAICAAAPAT